MRELRTEIDISAPSSKVWEILTNIEDWQEWNPIVNNASGKVSLGEKLDLTFCCEDKEGSQRFKPIVTDVKESKTFSWRGKMMADFLFSADRIFELEETESGTRLIHKEEFNGVLVPMFWSKLTQDALPMLDSMNAALKGKAEMETEAA